MTSRHLAPLAVAVVVGAAWFLRPNREGESRTALASACGDSTQLSTDPRSPQPGALFLVHVTGLPAGARLDGTAAGEPLHFAPDTAGPVSMESLAAIPIDDTTSLTVHVRCRLATRVDSLTVRVVAESASYPMEHLTVAPTYGKPPSPALAARMKRESDRALAVARRSHTTPRLWTEPFEKPRSTRITSGFGYGREFNGRVTSRHMGTDFAGTMGAEVKAANRGVVRIVDRFYLGGNVIYLDHGGGLTSAYLHLSKQLVAVGDTVERGQVIGLVGATGRVTGPHLHLIVRYGRITVDPLSLFAVEGG